MTTPPSPRPAITVCTPENRVCVHASPARCSKQDQLTEYYCSLPVGHSGDHNACRASDLEQRFHNLATWPNDSQPAVTLSPAELSQIKGTRTELEKLFQEAYPDAATQGPASLGAAGGELLPCPFCGAEGKLGEVAEGENFGGQFIECTNAMCGCSTCLMFPVMDSVKNQLAEKWNTRATPLAPDAREAQPVADAETPETDAKVRKIEHYDKSSYFEEHVVSADFARSIERRLLATQRELAETQERLRVVTGERELIQKHETECLETDSIVASCNCLTKTPEIKYHKPGCKYRLITERDSARAEVARLTKEREATELDHIDAKEAALATATARTEALEGALNLIGNCGQTAEPDHWKYRVFARKVALHALGDKNSNVFAEFIEASKELRATMFFSGVIDGATAEARDAFNVALDALLATRPPATPGSGQDTEGEV